MRLILPVAMCVPILAGCMRTTVTGGTELLCIAMRPISWSKRDTARTIVEIKQHNAAFMELCSGLANRT